MLALNWLELQTLLSRIAPEIEGLFVEGVVIPERPRFSEGYLKGEWAIRLTSRQDEQALVFSIRPRHPGVTLYRGKGPRASASATHSPFSLALAKSLKGSKLLKAETLPKERYVVLWFSGQGEGTREGLVLSMIPASPESFLVVDNGEPGGWRIVARSRVKSDAKQPEVFVPPNGAQAPEQPPIRPELFPEGWDAWTMAKLVHQDLEAEAFATRTQDAGRVIRAALKHTRERIRQSETTLNEAGAEPDWQRWGDLLKSVLHDPPPLIGNARDIPDYNTDETVRVPGDPKLNAQQQVERYYQQARRRTRRLSEAESRLTVMREDLARLEKLSADLPKPQTKDADALDWPTLERVEREAGIGTGRPESGPAAGPAKKTRANAQWPGRVFVSKDGISIHAGRTREENLELTFHHARGNDIWLHLRARPGAHVVIRMQPGKSAPLETLLDAANLVLHFSGGAKWGKTEVDYTFKKFVKRIKDSTEASYTNNKTLLVEPDGARLKRLLGG